ncbi:MauE/DoxX family redox-associated membrane protein [Nonomuraea muscovyensis]|uniref:MauE/DoxX family redox-associated membrane protein n=1 Tax=Nonomuraea muscovyensis TaxID=1124761 RepID=UPI0033F74EDB
MEIACRVLLAGVFAAALAGKLRGRSAYQEFAASIVALGVLPRTPAKAAAAAITAGEAVAVVLLAWPATAALGFGLSAVLLGAFAAGIVSALRRGRRAPCRCFGASTTPLGRAHVYRNLVLLAGSGLGLVAAFAGGPAEVAGVAVAAVAGAVAVVPVVRFDDLVSLFAPSSPAGGDS